MKHIHTSSAFHVNDPSVKNMPAVYDSKQTVTDKILFSTVSIIYVSFKTLCLKSITNGGSD